MSFLCVPRVGSAGSPHNLSLRLALLPTAHPVTPPRAAQQAAKPLLSRTDRPTVGANGSDVVRLEVESISKDFAGVHALVEVSLHVDQAEILGVIGPNGSGKTTLINVISGVIRPSGGQVRMDGKVLTRLPPYRVARSGIGRTFQNIRLFRDMTVMENVETAASRSPRAKGFLRPRRVSREALQVLELERLADTIVGSLPYGLQRRVEIARAIATQPRSAARADQGASDRARRRNPTC
jgi:ABC-type uncharacterized transport system ATPase subunit